MRRTSSAFANRRIEKLERRLKIATEENARLQKENQMLLNSIRSYKELKVQMQELEVQYHKGIREAQEMIAQCQSMISEGKSAKAQYSKQMDKALKAIR